MKTRKTLLIALLVIGILCLTSACRWGGNYGDGDPAGPTTTSQPIPGFTPEQIQEILAIATSEKANITLPVTYPAASFYRFDLRNEKGANRLSTILSYQDVLGTPTYGLESTAKVLLYQALRSSLPYEFDFFAFEKTLPKTVVDQVVTAMGGRFGDVEFLLRSDVAIGSAPEVAAVVQSMLPQIPVPAPASVTLQLLGTGPVDIDLKPRFSMLDNTTLMKLIFNDELRALFLKLQREGLASSPYFTSNVPMAPEGSIRRNILAALNLGSGSYLMGPVWATAHLDVRPAPMASDGPIIVRLAGTASGSALQINWPGPSFQVGAWKIQQQSKVLQLESKTDCSGPARTVLSEKSTYVSTGSFLLQGLGEAVASLTVAEARLTALKDGQTLGALTVKQGETAFLPLTIGLGERIMVVGTIAASPPGSPVSSSLTDEGLAHIQTFIALEKIEAPHPVIDKAGTTHAVSSFFAAPPSLRVLGLATGTIRDLIILNTAVTWTTDLKVTEVRPASAAARPDPLDLTVLGAGFNSETRFRLVPVGSGLPLPSLSTTLVGPGELRGQVSLASASPGFWTVEVFKPNGETAAGIALFTVIGPAPVVASITPHQGVANEIFGNVLVTGANFWEGAKVFLARTGFPSVAATSVTRKDGGSLACAFDLAGMATGTWNVEVVNPDGQKGVAADLLTVISPRPFITGFSPSDIPLQDVFDGLTIDGAHFLAGVSVRLVRGDSLPVTGFVTNVLPTRITCGFYLANVATGGWRLEVMNPDGQTATAGNLLAVFTPSLLVGSVSPATGENEGVAKDVQIKGAGFQTGAVVQLVRTGKSPVPAVNVRVASPTSLLCDVDLTGVGIGTWSIAVGNPDGETSIGARMFTVLPSPTRPAPVVTGIQPPSIGNLGRQTDVTVLGSGFLSGAAVLLTKAGENAVSGEAITVAAPNALTFEFDATRMAVGSWSVTVTNADDQSGTGTDLLEIVPSLPVIGSINPRSGAVDSLAAVTVSGSGFLPGATLTLVKDATEVQATGVTVGNWFALSGTFDLTGLAPGSFSVRVTNPGGRTSEVTGLFSVGSLRPVITDFSPLDVPALDLFDGLTINGSRFLPGLTVRLIRPGAVPVPGLVKSVQPTKITCGFDLTAVATGGWRIEVVNPDGQSVTAGTTLAVFGPLPSVGSISPASVENEGVAKSLQITGTGFVPGLAVQLVQNGGVPLQAVNVVVVSPTALSCDVDMTGAPIGTWNIVLQNPDGQVAPGAGLFTVVPSAARPAPVVTRIDPASVGNIGRQAAVKVTGSGFRAGAAVVLTKSGEAPVAADQIQVTDPTSLSCSFDATGMAVGSWSVTVRNADAQSGTGTDLLQIVPFGPFIATLTPALGSIVGTASVTLTGSGFQPGATLTLVSGTTEVTAISATVNSGSSLSGVLDLRGLATGSFGVRVTNPDGRRFLATDAFRVLALPPRLDSVSHEPHASDPYWGGWTYTHHLYGANFQPGASVRFLRAMYDPLPASAVNVDSPGHLSCSFGFASTVGQGNWTIEVTNPDGQKATTLVFVKGNWTLGMTPGIYSATPASGFNDRVANLILVGNYAVEIDFGYYVLTRDGAHVRRSVSSSAGRIGYAPDGRNHLYACSFDLTGLATGVYYLGALRRDGRFIDGTGFTVLSPPPTLTAITPDVGINTGTQTVNITGSGFVQGLSVRLVRAGRTPISGTVQTLISSASLDCQFDLTDAEIAPWSVEVRNPDGLVASLTNGYTILPPVATVATMTPVFGTNIDPALSFKLTGAGFKEGTRVYLQRGLRTVWAQNLVRTGYFQLAGTFNLVDLSLGAWDLGLLVQGESPLVVPGAFTVKVRPPSLASISPTSGLKETTPITVTIKGSGFQAGISPCLVKAGEPPIVGENVVVKSSSELTCEFPLAGKTIGTWDVQVENFDGGIAPLPGAFQVKPLPLTVVSASPASAAYDFAPTPVTIMGSGFQAGILVQLVWGTGSPIAGENVVVKSPTELACSFSLEGKTIGACDLRLANPDGGVASLPSGFRVLAPPAKVTVVTPDVGINTGTQILNITGLGFSPGMSARLVRAGRNPISGTVVTMISSGSMDCRFDLTGAEAAPWDLQVTWPSQSVATLAACFMVLPPRAVVATMTPVLGRNIDAALPFQLMGAGFKVGTRVFLQRGLRTVWAQNLVRAGYYQLSGTFNLVGLSLGAWDLGLDVPGESPLIATGAFRVDLQPPTLTSITPTLGVKGTGPITLTVLGSGFQSGIVPRLVRTGELPITGTNVVFKSSSEIACDVSVDGKAPGTWDFQVENFDGGLASLPGAFLVKPQPVSLASITPAFGLNETMPTVVTISGSGFQSGLVVRLVGNAELPIVGTDVTVGSSTELTCRLPLAGGAVGAWDVRVENPDGGIASLPSGFSVLLASPIVLSASVATGKVSSDLSFSLNGSGFADGATVRLVNASFTIPASLVARTNTNLLVATFPGTILQPGVFDVVVTNPNGLSGTGGNLLTISLPAPTVASLLPTTAFNTGVLSSLQVTGTHFVTGATARLTRTGLPAVAATGVTVTDAVTLTCSLDLTGLATGAWNLEVTNPDGQTATGANLLTVLSSVPTVSALQPSTGLNVANVDGIQITGSNFVTGMTVRLVRTGFPAVPATNVVVTDATTVTCSFDLTGLATGAWSIEMIRPDALIGTGTDAFMVTIPGTPAVGSISPNGGYNTSSITVQITGSAFAAGATAFLTRAGFSPVPGTAISLTGTTLLSARFDLTGLATGAWNVEVVNSGGATGTGTGLLTVLQPAPTVTAISPATALQNVVQNDVQVTGTGFLSGASVRLTRTGFPAVAATGVTVTNATTLSCSLDLTGVATGTWHVEVANTDGQAATGTGLFTVAPGPWRKTIGGTAPDTDLFAIEAPGGGFFLAGTTSSGDGDMSGYLGGMNDIWIAHMRDTGEIIWSKLIGGTGDDSVTGMVAAGTGFAIAGNTDSPMGDLWLGSPDSTKRAFAVIIDATGTITHRNQFLDPNWFEPSDARGGLRATADGGFILAGTLYKSYWYAWAVKYNASLQEQWQTRLAANSGQAYAYDVAQKADGNFLLCGYTEFGAGAFSGTGYQGGNDGFVFELASQTGDVVRGKCFGGTGSDNCTGVVPTPDGGFYVVGTTGSTDGTCPSTHTIDDLMLLKVKADFTVDWARSVGGSGSETGGRGQLASDGGLLYLGRTTSTDGDCTGAHSSGNMFSDMWLGKCNAAGSLEWQKFYGSDDKNDVATTLVQTADGGFLLGGYGASGPAGSGVGTPNDDFALIRERLFGGQ